MWFGGRLCLLVLCLWAETAAAQGPVAIVEEVHSKTAGVEFMDYLTVDRRIELTAGDKIVIGYLKSCWRETIDGGVISIGLEQSSVTGGAVERQKVRCQSEERSTVSKETVGSGAMVFRKKPERKGQLPEQTVYALSPVIEVGDARRVAIERLDRSEKPIEINLAQTDRRRFVDLAQNNVSLVAGALYRAKTGKREATFRVDSQAASNPTTIVGRLVYLPPG